MADSAADLLPLDDVEPDELPPFGDEPEGGSDEEHGSGLEVSAPAKAPAKKRASKKAAASEEDR